MKMKEYGNVLKVEKEDFIYMFIRRNGKDDVISLCYLLKEDIVSVKIDIDFYHEKIPFEIIVDYMKKCINILSSNIESNTNIEYTINLPLSIKRTNIMLEEINELFTTTTYHFYRMKYLLIPYIKLSISNLISNMNTSYITTIIKIMQEHHNDLKEILSNLIQFKDILIIKSLRFNSKSEYHTSTEAKCYDLLLKSKSYVLLIINSYKKTTMNLLQLTLNFNLGNIHYNCKANDYVYIENNTHKVYLTYKPFQLYYYCKESNSYNEEIYLYEQNNNVIMKYKEMTMIHKSDYDYIGVIDDEKETMFGIEKTMSYIHIGYKSIMSGCFDNLGMFITETFAYRGRFANDKKNDENCMIWLCNPNVKYQGAIKDDCIKGKGTYEGECEEIGRGIIKVIGEFKLGQIEGRCKIVYKNEDTFEGVINKNRIAVDQWIYTSARTNNNNNNNKDYTTTKPFIMTVNHDNQDIKYDY